ncbi:aldose 1-epimerase family protein [Acetobacter conturbans]|uniref:Aldose 1-epimerase family protein n=1 Tax=Acetobacter conturbans TaxID=1737472 RepID=A0ABX0JXV0_9PROT|nr:aldose 1-epimerase family protein [Acetobacter conturbans]NHN87649.1 aldose 1-epimerase family protein [Acetobacter conturbans]
MTAEIHTFGDDALTAAVSAQGAELVALRLSDGADVLWDAGSAWQRHSPVLFPIVGRLPRDEATIDGKNYRMTQHGFARDRAFRWVERKPAGCVLELEADEQSLKIFPFRFRLWLAYQIADGELTVTYTLRNMEEGRALPASLGAHPAFRWPLHDGDRREDYSLLFEEAEPEPIRRLEKGLLDPAARATPVEGRKLALRDDLFHEDAIIFDRIRSRSVVFGRPGHTGLRLSWHGFPELGVWTKPGAHFLCIEPWQGYATPHGFSGEFRDKPGLVHVEPHQEWTAHWSVKAVPA